MCPVCTVPLFTVFLQYICCNTIAIASYNLPHLRFYHENYNIFGRCFHRLFWWNKSVWSSECVRLPSVYISCGEVYIVVYLLTKKSLCLKILKFHVYRHVSFTAHALYIWQFFSWYANFNTIFRNVLFFLCFNFNFVRFKTFQNTSFGSLWAFVRCREC